MNCLILCFSWSILLKLLCSSATSSSKTQMLLSNYYIIFVAFTFFVAFCLLSVICKQELKQCNFSIDQSALLTRFQTDFTSSLWNFLSLSCRSSSPRNVSMQRQGARKSGCFHRLRRAKLQSNTCNLGYAWGKIGGFGIDWYIYPSLK